MPMPVLSGPPIPHARVIRSPMGGGWIVPLTLDGHRVLSEFFGEGPAELAPIGETGWMVEPYQSAEIAEALKAAGMEWEIG